MSAAPDYFVSVCLAQETNVADEIAAVRRLHDTLSRELNYWEIIYIVGESDRLTLQTAGAALSGLRNIRILLVRDGVGHYRRRAIAAAEAIGDVVILSSFSELQALDAPRLADTAVVRRSIVQLRSSQPLQWPSLSHILLGLIARHCVDARCLRSIAVPRNHLTGILARPTASLDLRFEPRRGAAPYLHLDAPGRRLRRGRVRRMELLSEIISTSAPRLLKGFAGLSVAVCALSFLYGLYALAVLLLKEDMQEGWFTTAITQAGSVGFLSLGLGVVALGLAAIIDRMEGGVRNETLDELGNISFYEHAQALNVEIEAGAMERAAQ